MDESPEPPRWSGPPATPGRDVEQFPVADGPLAGATLAAARTGTLWCFQRPGRIEVIAAKPEATIDVVQYDKVPDLLGHYAVDATESVAVLRWHPRPAGG